ncbi:RteC domain-containing protein [Algoriphagus terrigena]|uniref:RteC domain-containing protein n=1 Tax=Algoriphagus terrigena TaxID=344884 RepID=UPI0004272D12|nr:RteC domain-containing protein [Algoriphagus terrigena]
MNDREFYNGLFMQMKEEIAAVASSSSNRLYVAEQAYLLAGSFCSQISAPDAFESVQEEIGFFKRVRPGFEAELIYYGEVYYILSSLPERQKDALEFLRTQYIPSSLYRQKYRFLLEYFLLDRSDFDIQLFTKSESGESRERLPMPGLLPIADSNSTPAGKVFARFRAFDALRGFLEKEIRSLKKRGENSGHPVKWTAPKAALVELAYALKAAGAINHGNASIRDIAGHLERVFQVDLTQFYRTFQEIRIRKNSRTTFLDRLKEKLEKWMDNTDFNGKGED